MVRCICGVVACLCVMFASPALADRPYTVRDGDTLASIARRHRTSVHALRASNRLRNDRIRPGQELEIPSRSVIYVRPGDTLARLAARHGVSTRALARANRLRPSASLRIDQRLRLPGAAAGETREQDWGEPRKPGFIDVTRLHTRERVRMTAVDRRGRVRRAALRRLGRLMQSHRSRTRVRRPHRRLVALLAKISDHFGGRRITIVSGFRAAGGYTRATSKHTQGRAIDFRIRGVPNTALRDYCRRLSRVGVGYYPRSTFVHLDVRNRSAYWVDWSRPGQAPQYRRPGSTEEAAADGTSGRSEQRALGATSAPGSDDGAEAPAVPPSEPTPATAAALPEEN